MQRFNPQLGTYYVFSEITITRVNSKSVSGDDQKVYDKETGEKKGKDGSAYGSADYSIMSIEEAKENRKVLKHIKEILRD